MITSISYKFATIIGQYTEQEDNIDYIRYGLEIMIGGFIKIIVLFSIAFLLDAFLPMILLFGTFALFRSLTGGHHYSTYSRCLLAGLILLVGLAYITTIVQSFFSYTTISYLLYTSVIFGYIFTYLYAPSNHFYKKCTVQQKQKLRKISFIMIFVWLGCLHYCIISSYSTELILASIFGFLFQICSLHPYTYKFVAAIENLIDRR